MYDGKSGRLLNPRLVEAAMRRELKFTRRIQVFEEVSVEECWREGGRPPASTKWVEINRTGARKTLTSVAGWWLGTSSRSVRKGRSEVFAAMLPLEAKNLWFRRVAEGETVWRDGRWQWQQLMFMGIKKARLNVELEDDEVAFLDFPGGRCEPGKCGKCKGWLHGMKQAASA